MHMYIHLNWYVCIYIYIYMNMAHMLIDMDSYGFCIPSIGSEDIVCC